ncbi:hypothetical protein [Plantactinospora sp. KLBMP9567]|uniref:hypothetical protein n=1 Tax=Plantactinospora sp. KLBMP9567 TaxID=3085900 RepID=UPI0029812549|nr:hypothetical protein [Plantactinospora sp. KLBMP9567]MDW5324352.1 hypothetical protein [Plantactinospora sp. KLBMP9567]
MDVEVVQGPLVEVPTAAVTGITRAPRTNDSPEAPIARLCASDTIPASATTIMSESALPHTTRCGTTAITDPHQ